MSELLNTSGLNKWLIPPEGFTLYDTVKIQYFTCLIHTNCVIGFCEIWNNRDDLFDVCEGHGISSKWAHNHLVQQLLFDSDAYFIPIRYFTPGKVVANNECPKRHSSYYAGMTDVEVSHADHIIHYNPERFSGERDDHLKALKYWCRHSFKAWQKQTNECYFAPKTHYSWELHEDK